jgi:hypothetical protein
MGFGTRQDQHVIETFSTDGADEALGEGVVGGCLGRSSIEAPLDFGDEEYSNCHRQP